MLWPRCPHTVILCVFPDQGHTTTCSYNYSIVAGYFLEVCQIMKNRDVRCFLFCFLSLCPSVSLCAPFQEWLFLIILGWMWWEKATNPQWKKKGGFFGEVFRVHIFYSRISEKHTCESASSLPHLLQKGASGVPPQDITWPDKFGVPWDKMPHYKCLETVFQIGCQMIQVLVDEIRKTQHQPHSLPVLHSLSEHC